MEREARGGFRRAGIVGSWSTRGMGVTERWRGIFGLKGDKDLIFLFGQKFAG